MIADRCNQNLGDGFPRKVRGQPRSHYEALTILFELKNRSFQRHRSVRMSSAKLLTMRLAHLNGNKNAANILALAEPLPYAQILGVKRIAIEQIPIIRLHTRRRRSSCGNRWG